MALSLLIRPVTEPEGIFRLAPENAALRKPYDAFLHLLLAQESQFHRTLLTLRHLRENPVWAGQSPDELFHAAILALEPPAPSPGPRGTLLWSGHGASALLLSPQLWREYPDFYAIIPTTTQLMLGMNPALLLELAWEAWQQGDSPLSPCLYRADGMVFPAGLDPLTSRARGYLAGKQYAALFDRESDLGSSSFKLRKVQGVYQSFCELIPGVLLPEVEMFSYEGQFLPSTSLALTPVVGLWPPCYSWRRLAPIT